MFRLVVYLILFTAWAHTAEVQWQHLSSATNQLPLPSSAKVHAGSVVGDFDGDKTNDLMLAFSDAGPALVLLRASGPTNYSRLPVELEFLPIAPGGTAYDIDKDDDLDVVFGSDTGPEIWWWENPRPAFDDHKSWQRRTIRSEGGNMNRGQIFADILGKGSPQLVYWNQGTNHVFLSEIPTEVRAQTNWASMKLMDVIGAPGTMETLVPTDIDLDGDADLLAGNYLLLRTPALGFQMKQILVGAIGTAAEELGKFGRTAVGRFRGGTYPQVVSAPLGKPGRVYWAECKADPGDHRSWARRQLLDQPIASTASLAVADIDRDGNDDIFLSEMKDASKGNFHTPTAWIFYSDGRGNFRTTVFATGVEIFEAKLVDLDNDTDLDVVSTARTAGAPRVDIWLNVTAFPGPESHPK